MKLLEKKGENIITTWEWPKYTLILKAITETNHNKFDKKICLSEDMVKKISPDYMTKDCV